MKKTFLILSFVFSVLELIAQKITQQQYIDLHKDMAIQEMLRSGVPAAITLAQGILETESGNSILVKKSNNHFGIKCKAEWTGESVYHDDDESGECFRKYDSTIHSYRDHSDFLRTRSHYAFLFSLDPTDYKSWAYGLKKAGYATNPRYPQILIKTIEDYHLNDFTIQTMNQITDYSIYRIDRKSESQKIADFANQSLKKIEGRMDHENKKVKWKNYNGLKAVYADSGISLLAIATTYDIALSTLLDYNDLIDDGLLSSPTWLYLERKPGEGKQTNYVVKGNETLYEISQNVGIQLSYLLAYNGLNESDQLKKGLELSLKASNFKDLSSVVKRVDFSTTKFHEVKPKENLYTISKLYKVPVTDLRLWNSLDSDQLAVGQKIIVSK